jgi:DNA-binding XRE family transcriptional regulator
MKPQIIEKNGKAEWAVLPYKEYLSLISAADLAEDIHDVNEFRKTDDGERIPEDIVNKILDGESPVKVWRAFRGITQDQLAKKVGVSKPYISQIETGKRVGKTNILKSIADVLDLTLDELITHK